MPFIHYFYVFLWAVLAVLCFFIGRKRGLVGYLLTVFFLFMSIWYGLEAFGRLPVFDGVMGHVFRGVLIVFLIVVVFIWYRGRKAQISAGNKTVPHAEDCHCEHCEDGREEN
ncbi:MAG: hypothetical protein IJG99_04210 [Ruminococcus sp.]|nr:hypothetical protein [Ruminococcus sp.]